MSTEPEVEIECVKIYLNLSGDISIFCLICKCRLGNPNQIDKHFQHHFSTIPYKCYICNGFYSGFDTLIFHIKDEHESLYHKTYYKHELNEEKLLCPSPSSCSTHPRSHYQHKTLKIDEELNVFVFNDKPIFLDNNEEEFQRYDFEIKKEQNGIKHIITAINVPDINDDPLLNCVPVANNTNCDISNYPDQMNHRDYKIETKDKNRIKTTKSKRKYVYTSRRFMCDICGKCYNQRISLREHFQSHFDPANRQYVCDLCNKRFASKGYLKVHFRYHTKDRPYKCEICNKQFFTCSSLRNHSLIHLNIKRFKCNVCNKEFTANETLKEHERIHTGEKPFKCDICKLGFRRRDVLANHRRIHTGEKPFMCKMCPRNFPTRAALYGHTKSQHKNN